MTELAIKKIEKEAKAVSGSKEQVIARPVADALISFCRQDEEFAQAVYQSDKTFSDCCKEIVKGVGNSLSDIEAYNRAVRFYFRGAAVHVEMTIDLCADIKKEPIAAAKTDKKVVRLSLDDFLL